MEGEVPNITTAPHKAGGWLGWVVALVVALGAGGYGYWQYTQTSKLESDLSQQKSLVTKAEADAKALQDQLKKLEGSAPAIQADTDLILAATDAYVRAPVAAASEKFTYEVANKTGAFAKVKVAIASGGGYSVTLKKVDATWTVLFAGQDLPLKDMADKYGLPEGYYQK